MLFRQWSPRNRGDPCRVVSGHGSDIHDRQCACKNLAVQGRTYRHQAILVETRLYRTRSAALAGLLISSTGHRGAGSAAPKVLCFIMAGRRTRYSRSSGRTDPPKASVKPLSDANSNASVVRWFGRGDAHQHQRRTTPMPRPERAKPPS